MCCLFVISINLILRASGTPINAIPTYFLRKARQYDPNATEEHGQYMFGRTGPGCVQGMDELTTCNRLEEQDEWLLQVQREFRGNCLSADSHFFTWTTYIEARVMGKRTDPIWNAKVFKRF